MASQAKLIEAKAGIASLAGACADAPALMTQAAMPAHNAAASVPDESFFDAIGSRLWLEAGCIGMFPARL
jgi:hypothetical protein